MAPKKKVVEKEQAVLEKMAGTFNIDIEIGKEKYNCVSPTVEDHAKLFGTVYQAGLDEAEGYLKMLLRAGVSEELAVNKYDNKVKTLQPNEYTIFKTTNSLEGARYYFLACSATNHPELKPKDVEKMVDEDNWEYVIKRLNQLSPPPEKAKNE